MDRYELLQRYGSGSFGTVWKAKRKADGEVVAVKELRAELQGDPLAVQEIAIASRLQHPNCVGIQSIVRHATHTFLIMPFCSASLLDAMKVRRQLSEPELRWLGQQLLRGVSYLHGKGIVHRDIKPENVLLQESQTAGVAAMLCDFGESIGTANKAWGRRTSAPGASYCGTRWYRAPELLLHTGTYGTGVDMFALGCLLAEAALGRPLFTSASEADQLSRCLNVLGCPAADRWPDAYKAAAALGVRLSPMPGIGLHALFVHRAMSPAFLESLAAMLDTNPAQRATASQALALPFFSAGPVTPIAPPPRAEIKPGAEAAARAEAKAMQELLEAESAAASAASDFAGSSSESKSTSEPAAQESSPAVIKTGPTTAPASGVVSAIAMVSMGASQQQLRPSSSSSTDLYGGSAASAAAAATEGTRKPQLSGRRAISRNPLSELGIEGGSDGAGGTALLSVAAVTLAPSSATATKTALEPLMPLSLGRSVAAFPAAASASTKEDDDAAVYVPSAMLGSGSQRSTGRRPAQGGAGW